MLSMSPMSPLIDTTDSLDCLKSMRMKSLAQLLVPGGYYFPFFFSVVPIVLFKVFNIQSKSLQILLGCLQWWKPMPLTFSFFRFWEWVLTVEEFQCLWTSTNVRPTHWTGFLNECLQKFMLALMVLRSPCVFDKGFVCGCDGGCCWEFSQNVFGVSAESMQCSYDLQGNMVPTILLLLQKRLYDQGGLKVFFFLPSLAVSFLFCVAVLCF